MMKIRRIALMVFICIGFALGAAVTDDTGDPVQIVKRKLAIVTQIINNNDLDRNEKRSRIVQAVKPLFDLPLMAKLALGKKHWAALTEEQRQEFTSLYSALLEKTSIGKVELYANDRIDFKPSVKKGNKVYVPTELISEGRVVPITYKFYRSKNGWKIYDAEINGTSVILSHRTEYDALLRKGTIDDLLTRLKQSLK